MPDSTLTTMDLTLQLAASFGQGAGVLMIEADALGPVFGDYTTRLERSIPHWHEDAVSSIAVLRLMGAYAAHRALSERRVSTTRDDVVAALAAASDRAVPHHGARRRRVVEGRCASCCIWRR
jgi:hypothetical protein